ncbi:hypothetical protein HK098_000174 [Nowakowskiella sp. JEL0407]|nr:hypothetical protein HK098_000174 [Nowakowskiella sp. JEL0407]
MDTDKQPPARPRLGKSEAHLFSDDSVLVSSPSSFLPPASNPLVPHIHPRIKDLSRSGSLLTFNHSQRFSHSYRSSTHSLSSFPVGIIRANTLIRRSSIYGGAPVIIKTTTSAFHEEQTNSKLRWLILVLSCLLLFGNYYAYDNPAALNIPLQQHLNHPYDQYQFELNALYSIYSLPNMILPFVGGQLVDRMDPKKVLLFFSVIVCLGQTIFAIGVSLKSFPIMLGGRALFGVGGESISVVQASITTNWFKGKELGFALGLNLCIARFGSVANSVLSPRIEKLIGVSGAIWVGSVMCYISLFASITLAMLMAMYSPPSTLPPKANGEPNSPQNKKRKLILQIVAKNITSEPEDMDDVDSSTPLLFFSRQHSYQATNSFSVNKPTSPHSPANIEEFDSNANECCPGKIESVISALDMIRKFPFTFWLICLICVLLYGTVVPFNNIASDFLMSKWFPGDTETAGAVMSIPDTMSALLVPICGYIVDRYGYRSHLLGLSSIVIACVHLTLGLTMIYPVYPLIFLGLSYSIYGVAIWPSIATIIQHEESLYHEQHPEEVTPKLLGTAYGISTSALNTALTIMPMLAAHVRVVGGSFLWVELFFVLLAVAGAFASFLLWFVDNNNGGVLTNPEIVSEDMETEHIGYESGVDENDVFGSDIDEAVMQQ